MKAVIGLGSNLENPMEQIEEAVSALSRVPGIEVKRKASCYMTVPVGYADQPDFVNSAVEVETDLPPEGLLGVLLGIEAARKRIRIIKNGPRVIDMDLLCYEGETRNSKYITIPHPRMMERAFVLIPLMEMYTDGNVLDIDINEAVKNLSSEDLTGVRKI